MFWSKKKSVVAAAAPDLAEVVRLMEAAGHDVFENDSLPYNLNIVCVRNMNADLDDFDCHLAVFWRYRGEWHYKVWSITTYPGSYYLINRLLNWRGGAILAPGQYRGCYRLGQHRGKYLALCQTRGAVKVFRDGNRDRVFDMDPASIQEGFFGINIHAATTPRTGFWGHVADMVYRASAGCQVFRRMSDFFEFRTICEKAKSHWGNSFTVSLVERF